ncbi:IclR family transcriptional regulator [Aggregatilinea lenta]|uniref:IclR family transcriptional regulator n=1 Tax=Aggregatilinea lenta TaxID=913108 RepID=UPI0013C2DBE2|nr:IclR family transcriptional regulator [Aggregatilinea lenta]
MTKALAVLEIVANAPRGLQLSEVSAELGFDRSTTYRLLNTLIAAGYIVRDGSKRYNLSYRLVTLSRHLLADNERSRASREIMEWIAHETGETIHLSALDGMEEVLIQRVKGTQFLIVDFQIGERFSLHCTSVGKVLLAYQDERLIEQVIAAGLPQMASNTITDPDHLRQELRHIRSTGYAIDDHELADHMRCISVPVFEADGRVMVGLSISGPDTRLSLEKLEEYKVPLSEGARELSERLGGAPNSTATSFMNLDRNGHS